MGAALTMAVAVALFAYGGHRLDGWWGTEPWMLITGSALGVVGGFLHLIKVLAPEVFVSLFEKGPIPEDGSAAEKDSEKKGKSGPGADLSNTAAPPGAADPTDGHP